MACVQAAAFDRAAAVFDECACVSVLLSTTLSACVSAAVIVIVVVCAPVGREMATQTEVWQAQAEAVCVRMLVAVLAVVVRVCAVT